MMSLLLKFEGYPPAVVFALLLHVSIALFFIERNLTPDTMVKIEPPSISVSMAKESPQRLRRIQETQRQADAEAERRRQAQAAERQREVEAQRQREAEAERQRQAQAQRQREAEAERQRQAEAQRQREAEAERQRQAELQRQREVEAERQRQAELQRQQQAEAERQARLNEEGRRVENDLVAQYYALIKGLIQQNWLIPPSATSNMRAVVTFNTTPVGDILNARISESSGDTAFDRSVLQAVERVGDLQELRDLPIDIYERNMRTITLEFQNEDLIR